MRVAFLGNFGPDFSTENEYKWTFEQLGHQVLPLQEARVNADTVFAVAASADVFCWVNTHGWNTPGPTTMDEVLSRLRDRGTPTFGMHLDRYQGLNIGDGREGRVGTTAWWKMDYLFTADGGNAKFFKSRGVNHFWLPPAVAKRHCFIGTPRDEYRCDVAWVGAKGYHPEYPFRTNLVDWLEAHALRGSNVKIWGHGPRGGVRGAPLNDIYASAKIVVGDSCFAGAPYYWSDRVPETCGRRGFLLHPHSDGMTIPVATYRPGDLGDLQDNIEFYLGHPDERARIAQECFEHVCLNDTYHNRVREMFNVMELS